ncbi:MAG: hypothetical protein U1F57_09195 [bacterium]
MSVYPEKALPIFQFLTSNNCNEDLFIKKRKLVGLSIKAKKAEGEEFISLWNELLNKKELVFTTPFLRELAQIKIGMKLKDFLEYFIFGIAPSYKDKFLFEYLENDLNLLQSPLVIRYIIYMREKGDSNFLDKLCNIIKGNRLRGRRKREENKSLPPWQMDWIFAQIFYHKKGSSKKIGLLPISKKLTPLISKYLDREFKAKTIKDYFDRWFKRYKNCGLSTANFETIFKNEEIVSPA